jgi:hypothetical protein
VCVRFRKLTSREFAEDQEIGTALASTSDIDQAYTVRARADKQRRTSGVVGGTSRPDVSFFYELDGKTVSIDAKETSGPQKYQFDAVFPPDRATARFSRPSRRTPTCFGTRIHPARALEVRHRVRCAPLRDSSDQQ